MFPPQGVFTFLEIFMSPSSFDLKSLQQNPPRSFLLKPEKSLSRSYLKNAVNKPLSKFSRTFFVVVILPIVFYKFLLDFESTQSLLNKLICRTQRWICSFFQIFLNNYLSKRNSRFIEKKGSCRVGNNCSFFLIVYRKI